MDSGFSPLFGLEIRVFYLRDRKIYLRDNFFSGSVGFFSGQVGERIGFSEKFSKPKS